MENNQIIANEPVASIVSTPNALQTLFGNLSVYCTFDQSTDEGKDRAFNAMQDSDHKIGELINTEIEVKDLIAHSVELTDQQTGEIKEHLRIVLINPNGETFASVSDVFAKSVANILGLYGEPQTWTKPMKFKVKQVLTKNGKSYTLVRAK